ncbi:MAG: chromosome segregation protein SMC [Clostridia bacterium]|nr:chromosome segregation protein SMC [Clostridia bacterium]
MYLKSIEMQGFKSFPDRTKLIFDPGHKGADQLVTGGASVGVTVIVGPNGSGKSNIADAMRWVLGEISSKTLRSSKMEDVIFGGADSRRPMGYAEVSVTFDNTSDFGKLDCPYDEITVTRRYFRAGESEYLINRKTVRLKDIYELFLNTGIGRDGYSIIGQGRIADMVSRKSEERRSVFEDASGIAKYRVKKNEAERKLNAAEANLVRLRDIYSEVEAQVGPLEKEANKARKGIVLLENKKRADISLWLYDTDRLSREIADATSLRNRAEFDLNQAEEAVQALDVQRERLTEMTQGSRAASEELRSRIAELTESQHKLDSEYRVTETTISHTEELITAAAENREGLLRQLETDKGQLAARRETCRALAEALAGLEGEYDRNDAEIKALREKVEDLDTLIDTAAEDIRDREAALMDIRVRLSVLETTRDSDSDRNSGILSEIEEYEATSKALQKEVDDYSRVVDGYNQKIGEITAGITEADAKLAQLNESYGDLHERHNTAILRRDSVTQRISTYRAMEAQFEGYADAVKFVMKAYREGRINGYNGAPCGKIYGPLSQLISVEQDYVTAVETALGASLQNIVVEDEDTAKAAIYALKRANAGRTTFYPLTSMRPSTETDDMKRAVGFAGYVAVADTLVTCDDRYRCVLSSLLGRTLVFDTIDNATAMAKALKYRVRVVTLDGQQINVGGSFTGGSTGRKNSSLSRAAEIKRMEEDLTSLETNVSRIEAELTTVREEIKKTDSEKILLEDKRDLTRAVMAGEVDRLNRAKANLDANDALLTRVREDSEAILRQNEENEETMVTLRAEEKGLETAIAELRELRAEKAEERGDKDDAADRLEAKQTQLTITISATRKDMETEETLAGLCEERIRATEGDISVNDERVAAYRRKLSDCAAAQAENRRLFEEGETALTTLLSDRARADENSASFESKLNSLSARLREQMDHKENLFREFTTADSKLMGLQGEMDKLSGRLWDDYELSRAEAVALDYPPVTPENRAEVVAVQTECRNKLRFIGHFDPEAVEKYNETKKRYDEMTAQLADMEKSRDELMDIIGRLEKEMKTSFVEAFDKINDNFRATFAELFGGGSAELSLTDPENVLECGIEIKAAPPGKIIKNLMQLSGGEQAFIGVALFFAILKVNPTPFCILDEIEAALDEVNVERLAQYIKRYSDETQFIMITHRRGTMAAATRLYGVTMPERGISKVLTLDVADIAKNKENDWNGLFS